jgi:phenylalanyl-tRNA synthetase beta chain
MKVSLNWLKEYVDIQMGVMDLAHLLTMAGLEVGEVVSRGEGLERVVVAQIDSIRKHPNADRLSLVDVRTDRDKFSIVCGASNIREGQRVPLALIGAKLPNGLEIKRSKIRGVSSEGMLCSEIELGFGRDASGIMILPSETPLGNELADALGLKDTILDLSVTPNRPDWLCVIGVAREIAALTHKKVKYPRISLSDLGDEIHGKTSVTLLDPDLCPRYAARMVEGVKIGPSPQWMRDRLEKAGVRAINNVVDITNYVMMEYGQPLHAFDFEVLEEGRIVVRRAEEGEAFVTLDGIKRIMSHQDLMICDGKKPVAIAGVMGGLNSEIREETTTVFLESAYFDPLNNRRTSTRLGLETEAAYRFGRGIDYGACLLAANRATQLIQEFAGGRVVSGVIDAYPAPLQPKPISLRVSKANQVLGTEVAMAKVRSYLEDLELNVREEREGFLTVIPPSYRGDLEREIDLIEEIARLDGYEHIPITLPANSSFPTGRNRDYLIKKRAVEVLVHHGFHEVIAYSFVSPTWNGLIGLSPEDRRSKSLCILNPLTEDFSVMRTTLIPGLLETVRYNLSRKNTNLKIFELGKVFLSEAGEKLPKELRHLAGIGMGSPEEPHWSSPSRPIDFYDIKGCVVALLDAFQVGGVSFERIEEVPYLHPGRSAKLLHEGETLGVLGEIHPEILSRYDISERAYLFELNFEALVQSAREEKRFQLLPRFPAIYRDLSLVVDASLESGKLTEAIRASREPHIEEVTLFDVYEKAPIPEGKKGVSYRIRYQASDRTLTDEEVNQYHERITGRLREIFLVELRQ